MASTTEVTTPAVATSSKASNDQTNSVEVPNSSSNSSPATAQSSATIVSTIPQLKTAPVVSPTSAAALSTSFSGTVSKPLSNQAANGPVGNAKQVRAGSAAKKPGSASGSKVLTATKLSSASGSKVVTATKLSSASGSKALKVKPALEGIATPDVGKARDGDINKPTTPLTTGSAKSASAQRKASNDRPVSAIAAAHKAPNSSSSTNAIAMAAKKGGAEDRTPTTISAAVASRDRPLTASHAGAMSNASGSKKEDTSSSDPAATLVVVHLPPTTSLEQVRQLFEKNWPLANSRQVLPKGPKDPLGNQVYITFSKATDADMAFDVLCYKPINGNPLRLVKATNLQKLIDPSLGLRISNLPTEVNEQEIQDTFSALGEIISIELLRESSGTSKGVAIVHFADKEISNRVLEFFTGKTLGTNIIKRRGRGV